MQNPYEPPKEYTEPTKPLIQKYEEQLIDWTGVIIILGALSVIIAFTLIATLLSK